MSVNKFSIFVLHASDFLTNHRSHGDGLTAFGFISRLAERGHTLHVAVPELDIEGPLPANLKLHRIKTTFQSTIPHRLEYMVRSRRLLNRLRRTAQIDVIHQLNPVNKGLSLAMLGAGLPLVLGVIVPSWPSDADEVGPRPGGWQRAFGALKQAAKRGLLALQQWQASALLLATPMARQELVGGERSARKFVHVPLGVDATRFRPDAAAKPDEPTILFLANLWRRKGIFTLLDAFAQVVERMPQCRLVIAGGGGEQEAVARLVAAAPHRDRIKLLGPVGREQVPELLRRCTVYCHPAYGEPFANSVLEALASGKPIVATNAGGISEMVPNGGGRKVPPRDADALAAALIEVLASPALQAEMGRCNRQKVEQFYDWERVIDQLEAVYEQVITAPLRSHAASSLENY